MALVIQGGAEMGKRLSEDEVQRALDFCVRLFSPTTPEQHESVRRKLSEAMLSEDDEDAYTRAHDAHLRQRTASGDSQASQGQGQSLAERLMDVHAPIVDPGVLARLLRPKLPLFRRYSSASMDSVHSAAASSSTSGGRSASTAPSTGPSSPVSDVFSVGPPESLEGDNEVRMVLEKVNARRVIHAEHGGGLNSLEQEALDGRVMRLVRGQLGLVAVGVQREV